MAVFKDTTITDAGKRLLAKALANGQKITFTKLETSDFDYDETMDIEEVINLNQVKQSINLSSIVQEGTLVTVKGVFTNRGLVSPYEIKTIGCFAKINDENEILYSITRVQIPDIMPAENGINLSTIEIELVTQINNESGAIIKYNPDTMVTRNTLASETEAGLVTLRQITEKIRTEAPSPNNASNTTYGLTKYGTTAGTALEGNRLAEILGVEYGGILQQVGQKELNKAYYDTVNRQLVMPIIENALTYFESTKFSILSLKNTQEFVIYTDTLLENDYHTRTLEVNIDVAEGTLRQYKYFNVFGGVSGFTKIPIDIILSRKNVKFTVSLDESTGYDASLALRFNQNRLTVIAYGKVDSESHVKVMKIYRVTLTNM